MFDPVIEAHLRRQHRDGQSGRRDLIVPAAIALNFALWGWVVAAIM
ncbi:MAG: hypothetical protein ACK4YU_15355 [Paracoccus sp. (in: a-proteobacteria)]